MSWETKNYLPFLPFKKFWWAGDPCFLLNTASLEQFGDYRFESGKFQASFLGG